MNTLPSPAKFQPSPKFAITILDSLPFRTDSLRQWPLQELKPEPLGWQPLAIGRRALLTGKMLD